MFLFDTAPLNNDTLNEILNELAECIFWLNQHKAVDVTIANERYVLTFFDVLISSTAFTIFSWALANFFRGSTKDD